jgi:serine/threonine protein kinase
VSDGNSRAGEHPGGFAAALTAGARVAGYLLEEQIGAGGMAVVFRARDERLDRLVALKMLSPSLAPDEDFRRRFIRESRAAAKVDDPHIIPVFEAGEVDGLLFIAMRYVRGGDVRSMIDREGPLGPGRAVAILSAVASALDAAHAAGLVHRDVKPANMLVDAGPGRPEHVYLSDFGLTKGSRSSMKITATGQLFGTLAYLAPEQIQGRPIDGRADQYALGCAAFELLTGAPPFPRDEPTSVMWAHMTDSPPLLAPRVPDGVDLVLAKAMAKSPEERYGTCREFTDALQDAFGLTPPSLLRKAAPPAGPGFTSISPIATSASDEATHAAAAGKPGNQNSPWAATLTQDAEAPGRPPAGEDARRAALNSGNVAHARRRRYRLFIPLAAVAIIALTAAAIFAAGHLDASRAGSQGHALAIRDASTSSTPSQRNAATSPSPSRNKVSVSPTSSQANAGKAAETFEADPTKAMQDAENAVGNCLQTAWSNAGYNNVFDRYAGNGIVQFSTGTTSNPTGSAAAGTLISVQVYGNGNVTDNQELDRWGCSPYNDNAASAISASDLSCQVIDSGSQPEYEVSGEVSSGTSYIGSLQVTFYDSVPDHKFPPALLSANVTVSPPQPWSVQLPLPSADYGASAEPTRCTADPRT